MSVMAQSFIAERFYFEVVILNYENFYILWHSVFLYSSTIFLRFEPKSLA